MSKYLLSVVLLAVLSVACTGAPTTGPDAAAQPDAGPWYPSDLPTLARGATSTTDPMHLDPTSAMSGDWSCVGAREPPVLGAPGPVRWQAIDFQTHAPIAGACVHLFADGVVTDVGCAASDPVTSASGDFVISMPSGGFATVEMFAIDDPDAARRYGPTLIYDELNRAPTQIVYGVSASTLQLIPALGGHVRVDGTGLIGISVADCMLQPVFGAVMRIADADGHYLVDGTTSDVFAVGYFNGSMRPYGAGRWTQADGIAYAVNVPVPADGRPYFVEAWGRVRDGAPPQLIYCDAMRVQPDAMTIGWGSGPPLAVGPACPGRATSP